MERQGLTHSRSGQVTAPMKEMLVHVGRQAIEIAVMADGRLVEYDIEEAAGGKLPGTCTSAGSSTCSPACRRRSST
ncbi:MAG: hypothetical protein A9Z00_06995 [Thermobacillus sp. ZCTH02-B1]|nr:MAG: hypothetical protein A9Z00_06995 [Thermobacillus sp. ZCTH02-B1]